MLSTIAFLFFIVFPAVAIFAYISRITSGIYHWADRQHPKPNYQYPETVETITYVLETETKTTTRPAPSVEERYFGHSEDFEDSREFAALLDSKRFDVKEYLKK